MDYKIFATDRYNLTTLDSVEISNPLIGLKEFLVGRSAGQFKQHLRDLLFSVFEKHGWRQYGVPVNLYVKAQEIAKLMDFVWLITTCEIGTQRNGIDLKEYYLTAQYRCRTFGRLFKRTAAGNKAKPMPIRDVVRAIFAARHGLLMKADIEEVWLGAALNSSYMSNLTIDFNCVDSSTEVQDFWYMMTIIDAAFELANGQALQMDAEKLKYYELFASDADHPDCLLEEDIEFLFEGFHGVFWYIDEVKLPKAIRKWFSLISKTDHWENHNDPGNILFIKKMVQGMMETAWLWNRVGFPELNTQGINKEYVKDLSASQLTDPIAYIGYFFERHRLHEWKRLLVTWLTKSLSDGQHRDAEVTEQDCEDIIKLLQVLRLIEHRM